MGNKDKKRARESSDREQGRRYGREDVMQEQLAANRPGMQARESQERGFLKGQYGTGAQTGFQDTGGRDRARGYYDRLAGMYGAGGTGAGGGGGGGDSFGGTGGALGAESRGIYSNFGQGGGVDMGALTGSQGAYEDIRSGGGYTGGGEQSIRENISKMGGAAGNIQGYAGDVSSAAGDVRGAGQEAMGMREGWQGLGGQYGDFGGISDPDLARMRGGGVYDEFAATGGMTPEMMQNMRRRSTDQLSSVYDAGGRAMNRESALRGGQGLGGASNAARLQMMRDQGQGMADVTRGTELDIANQQRAGRLQGAQGMVGSEGAVQGRLAQNQLASLAGQQAALSGEQGAIGQAGSLYGQAGSLSGQAGGLEGMAGNLYGDAAGRGTALEQNLVGNRLAAGQAYDAMQGQAQGMRQQGMLAGAGGMWDIDQARAAEAERNAAAGAAGSAADANMAFRIAQLGMQNEADWGGRMQQGRMGAVGGYHDLYSGGAGGEYQQDIQNQLAMNQQGTAGGGQTTAENIQIGQMPGMMDAVAKGAGAVGGIMGGFTGLGGAGSALGKLAGRGGGGGRGFLPTGQLHPAYASSGVTAASNRRG